MANGMGGMKDMNHCSLCSEEDRQKNNECPTDAPGEVNNEVNFDAFVPFGHNCDCDFKQDEKSHHANILQCESKQVKPKIFTAILPKFEFVTKKKTYAISQKSITTGHSYLKAYKTIQKLE